MRLADNAETKQVAAFFESWQDGLSQEVLGEHDVAFVDRDGETSVVLVSPDLAGLPEEILAEADHAGLRIGTWEDDGFRLDLQGAVLAGSHTRRLVVRVSEKAAQIFLYGKDLIGTSIKSFDPRLNAGDTCIVCNPRWEPIGLGVVTGRFKGEGTVVENLYDLGAYLRDQD